MSYTPVEVSPDSTQQQPTHSSDEKPYSHNHHHHHSHREKERDSYYRRYVRDGTWGAWICIGFFGVFFLTTIILLIVYGVQWNETNHHMHELEAKMANENSRLTNNGIYTVSDSAEHHRIEYDLSLCDVDMYQLSKNPEDPILLTLSNTIAEEEVETYQTKVFLKMRYNVEAESLLVKGKKARNGRGKFWVVDWEMTSNYPEFSTVRLVEKSLDAYTRRLEITKDINLCSNNPSKKSQAPRCSRLTTVDGFMVLNNTDFFPMEPSSSQLSIRHSSTQAPTNSRDLQPEEEEEEEGEEEYDDEEVVLEEEITDLRYYEIYCYRETDNKDDDFIEYLSLTIKPQRCRVIN